MIGVMTELYLERTLARFIARHVETYRLGNVQESTFQEKPEPGELEPESETPEEPEERPDEFDDLALKVPPKVIQGFAPKTVTGAVDTAKLPAYPFISVRALSGRQDWTGRTPQEIVTASIIIGTYDEATDRRAYQDCLILVGAIKLWLPRYRVLDQTFSIVAPIAWEMSDADLFPHFIAEITTQWQLPTPSHIAEVTTQTPYVPRDLRDLVPETYPTYANSD